MKTLCLNCVKVTVVSLSLIAPCELAQAEPSAADKSLATQLFNEGRALLDDGHTALACRKLEESQRLDPGGGTLLNLALCHEKDGRTATAWAEFTEALGIAKREDRPQRVDFARSHIQQLEPSLSRLIVQVPRAQDLPDLEIRRDGTLLGRAAWGSAMPLDPGEHLIEASALGKRTWQATVTLGAKGDLKTIAVPPLDDAPADARVEPVRAVEPSSEARSSSSFSAASRQPIEVERDVEPASGSAMRTVGWVALGLGVAADGVGTYFALHAASLKNDADALCPNDRCSAQGAQKNRDAITSANFATAGVATGAVGFVLGVVLIATSPTPARERHARAGLWLDGGPTNNGARLAVSGRF